MSMKHFNKASLALAVASALAASSAQAVNIAEDGLGEYIFSPYYTVRNGFETYINVHNTSGETVAFKIRFRESINSRDVRDFNVVLSPYDVWTAAVTLNEAGNAARLETGDYSCTVPESIRSDGIDFTNYLYTGSRAKDDPGPTDLERTMEGYFEIINMGQTDSATGSVAANALHIVHKEGAYAGERAPVDCGKVEKAFADDVAAPQFSEPENSLKVNVAIINVNDGLGFAVPVTTLANFYNPNRESNYRDGTGLLSDNLVVLPGTAEPNASSAMPAIAELTTNAVTDNDVTVAYEARRDAMSAVLMRANAINQYRIEEGQADTDWVLTFPTRNQHIDPNAGGEPETASPFAPFKTVNGSNPPINYPDYCVEVGYHYWDREEDTKTSGVLPSPTEIDVQTLCNEVNVLQLGEGVLSSRSPELIDPGFGSGWMRVDFGPQDTDTSGAYDLVSSADPSWNETGLDFHQVVLEGLPVIGFAIQNLDNWSVSNELVQYGFAWDHAYGRSIGVWRADPDGAGPLTPGYYQMGNGGSGGPSIKDMPPTIGLEGTAS